MDLSKLKDKLDDATFGELESHIADLTGQRDAARKESIDGRKKMKAENEQLKALKDRLFDRLGIDAEEEIDTLPDAKGQAEAAKQYEAKIKRLEREAAERGEKLTAAEQAHRSLRTDMAIEKALGGHEWIDRDVAATLVRGSVSVEDDQVLYRVGDKLVPLDDGVKALATAKPYLVKAQGAGGSGYTGSRGNGAAKTMTRAEFMALDAMNQMARVKEGVSITD